MPSTWPPSIPLFLPTPLNLAHYFSSSSEMRRATKCRGCLPNLRSSSSPMSWLRCKEARLDEGTLSSPLKNFHSRHTSHPLPQENNSVTELREKIKTFLASQGMIKGHSGSGPRSTEGDPPVLVLVENLHNHPSSPATPTLSQSSNDYRPQGPLPPTIRDGPHYAHPIPPPHDQHYPSPAPPSMFPFMFHHYPYGSNSLQAGTLTFQS